jgi:NAD-dependent SIR2 family protein deacetylase
MVDVHDWQPVTHNPEMAQEWLNPATPEKHAVGMLLPADTPAPVNTTTCLGLAAAEECDVFLSIGTSEIVYPAAELPLRALGQGATLSFTSILSASISSVRSTSSKGQPRS